MKNIAATLHLFLCKKKHISSNGEDLECEWYGEEGMEDCWSRPTHLKWLSVTEKIAETTALDNIGMEKLSNKLVKILQDIKSLKVNYKPIESFIVDFISKGMNDGK